MISDLLNRDNNENTPYGTTRAALLFESLKHKTHVLHMFIHRATVDTYVVEVESNKLLQKSRMIHPSSVRM
jgi:hypothetical protein